MHNKSISYIPSDMLIANGSQLRVHKTTGRVLNHFSENLEASDDVLDSQEFKDQSKSFQYSVIAVDRLKLLKKGLRAKSLIWVQNAMLFLLMNKGKTLPVKERGKQEISKLLEELSIVNLFSGHRNKLGVVRKPVITLHPEFIQEIENNY